MYQYQLKATAFKEYLERERQEWLAAGMTEAEIYEIHFGKPDEDGRGGDYGVWLTERKHYRGDHKYAPGVPVAIDTVDPESARIADGQEAINEVAFQIDLEAAMLNLTPLQRRYFTMVRLDEYSVSEAARLDGKDESTVREAIKAAEKKLKKYFS
jgi:DNA-binding CsgD family transcriptional regulator